MLRSRHIGAAVAVAWPVALAPPAAAAPQVLALIATDRPAPLACRGAYCTAELPAVCLQPGRRAPQPGRGYRLAAGQAVTLVGGAAPRELAAEVRLAARRTHVAVEISIPRALVGGLADPAVHVGAGVSAVPVPAPGDARPQTAAEVAEAVGPRRRLARALVDDDALRMPAVRMTKEAANRIRAGGAADRSWAEIVADARARGVPEAAVETARFMRRLCAFKLEHGLAGTLTGCLAGLDDDAMSYLGARLEDALEAGS